MAPITFYWARGNGEQFGGPSMCTNVTRLLDKSVFDVREVNYNAFVQTGYQIPLRSFNSWMTDNKNGTKPWMGLGYSLGAVLMGDHVGTLNLSMCKGVGLIADGRRHRMQYYGPRRPAGWGIAGERLVGNGKYPVWSMTEPNDSISELPGDNGLRNLAPFLGFPKQPQPAREIDAFYSMQWLGYYFPGNRHTNYAVEKVPGSQQTYTQTLARLMNDEARRLIKSGAV